MFHITLVCQEFNLPFEILFQISGVFTLFPRLPACIFMRGLHVLYKSLNVVCLIEKRSSSTSVYCDIIDSDMGYSFILFTNIIAAM